MKDSSYTNTKITYYSACLRGGTLTETNVCYGLKVGDVVKFTAEIVVTQCLSSPADWNKTFKIHPVGTPQELVVDLTTQCECPTENHNHSTPEVN